MKFASRGLQHFVIYFHCIMTNDFLDNLGAEQYRKMNNENWHQKRAIRESVYTILEEAAIRKRKHTGQ